MQSSCESSRPHRVIGLALPACNPDETRRRPIRDRSAPPLQTSARLVRHAPTDGKLHQDAVSPPWNAGNVGRSLRAVPPPADTADARTSRWPVASGSITRAENPKLLP